MFISYRRQDTQHLAGRLYDRLRNHFGKERVFMDVDSIEPGLDFGDAIEKAVSSTGVMLVLIGDHWLTSTDQKGRRRLDNPDDYVRLEIEATLSSPCGSSRCSSMTPRCPAPRSSRPLWRHFHAAMLCK